MLLFLLIVFFWLLFLFLGSWIPVGNENSTVRRIPFVTFGIMSLCVLTFYVMMPSSGVAEIEMLNEANKLGEFIKANRALAADENVRRNLQEIGYLSKSDAEEIQNQLSNDPALKSEYDSWLRTSEATHLREEFAKQLVAFQSASEARPEYQFGLSPNGKWKIYQLITCAFLHANYKHLYFNLLFFFSIAFVLEDLWGRSGFLGFYLSGAVVSCIPFIVSPAAGPLIGASGAISATMGAFLVRLPKTKIKLIFWPARWLMLFSKRKPIIAVPSYIFLLFYFIENLVSWSIEYKSGSSSGTAFSAHIAGFVYGAAFAAVMRATKYEETHINPKIEAKVSFAAPQAVQEGLEMMDKGNLDLAERKLRSHLMKDHDNLETILALIHVYEKQQNYDQLNTMYGRLIRYHLQRNDKEAALLAYDNLLSVFPDNKICARIPPRDWLVICDYLREAQMNREAAVEYERMANAWPDDANTMRALVQGAECALAVVDPERALRLYEMAEKLSPPQAFASKIAMGLEKCHRILENHPNFKKHKQNKKPVWT